MQLPGSTVSLNGSQIRKLKKGMAIYRTRNQKLIKDIQDQVLRAERRKKKLREILHFLWENLL